MPEDTIRVGILGAGGIARGRHLPGFQKVDGVKVVAVSNRSRESGQRIADDFGIPNVVDKWTDVVADPDIDAICIGTWPYMHRTMVLAALEHDKHVLTEARFAMNAADAREMLQASRAKPGLVTQIVPAGFTFEVDQTIADLLSDGYVGQILSVDMDIQQGLLSADTPAMWRHDRELSGFNVMLVGAWYECMMRWVGEVSSVTALSRVVVTSRPDGSGSSKLMDIPDHVEILGEFPSGAMAHLRFSEANGMAPPNVSKIIGTEGTLQVGDVDLMGDDSKLYGGQGRGELTEIEIPPEKKGHWRVEEQFINAIRGNERVTHNTFETGVKYMEFTEAVTRSARSRSTVFLPL